ncbi:MAG TPA: hypothetical protein VJL29_02430 [Thermoguttaceae bacterium]|nr:hypothetical protein [Thermoguttaceae bacterium]
MSTPLPYWIQRLLGIDVGPGEGASWRVEYAWGLPTWATVLLVIVLVAFVVMVYSREGRRVGVFWKAALATIRLALVGLVLLMMSQLVLCIERTGPSYLAVVLDDSASMTVVDRYEGRADERLAKRIQAAGLRPAQMSRENLAKMLLLEGDAKWLRRFGQDYKLRFYFLTGARESRADEPGSLADEIRRRAADGRSTRLGETVARVLDDLRGTTPAGIVLLTDGINTEGPGLDKAAALARRRGVPLLIVGLGDDRPVADFRLTDLLMDDVVFADDVVFVEATLSAPGYGGRPLRVTLRQEGRADSLAEMEVTADAEELPQTVRIPYRPTEPGRFRWTIEVEPVEGELQTDNNRLTGDVEVRKERIRVLLVQAYPNFEYRYLRQMLGRDPTIRLHTLLQEADPEYAQQDAAALAVFPVRREKLFEYDVVILGDVDFRRLGESALENLAALVDRPAGGGSLVFLAGPEYDPTALRGTPLERLLPIGLGSVALPQPDVLLTEGFTVEPTALGLASPAMQLGDTPDETETIWANLPPLYWMIDAPEVKPGARVLAVNPRRMGHGGRPLPVIVLQYVGAGKVLMHTTDETWRWRLGVGDRYFARYWVQMIRYLARSKLMDKGRGAVLDTDRREYRSGETVRFRMRWVDPRRVPSAGEDVVLVVEQEGGRTRRVPMVRQAARDMFEGVLDDAAPGRYHTWVAGVGAEGAVATVDFTVAEPAGEFEHVQMEAALLREAARQTRGRFYTIDDADNLISELPSGGQAPIETLPPVPLWNRWPMLALFLALLVTEWVARKWKGMV